MTFSILIKYRFNKDFHFHNKKVNTMIEIWKFYKETKSKWGHRIYEVSNFGSVKVNGEIFIPTICSAGYYILCRNKLLHRIAAELFLPGWNPNLEVDHIDGNKLNNRIDNLRMCSHKENMNNPVTLKNKKGKGGHKHTEEEKENQRQILTGRKKIYRDDGTWYWIKIKRV